MSRYGAIQDALEPLVVDYLAEQIREGLDEEIYTWVADPEVSDVYGLRVVETGEIVLIFYRAANDFECNELHFAAEEDTK